MKPFLDFKYVKKQYCAIKEDDFVKFNVGPVEIVGVIWPNGSG